MHQELENLEWEDFCIPVVTLGISWYDPEYSFISYKTYFSENFYTFFLFFDNIWEEELYGKKNRSLEVRNVGFPTVLRRAQSP